MSEGWNAKKPPVIRYRQATLVMLVTAVMESYRPMDAYGIPKTKAIQSVIGGGPGTHQEYSDKYHRYTTVLDSDEDVRTFCIHIYK